MEPHKTYPTLPALALSPLTKILRPFAGQAPRSAVGCVGCAQPAWTSLPGEHVVRDGLPHEGGRRRRGPFGGTLILFWVPVVVLGLGNGTVSEVTRHLRTHLEGVLREDYMRTARAKGARLWRHLYKDGLVMPLSSLLANKIPYVLGGAIVVEQVFNWPGMGRLTWQAASDRDYPVLLGVTLLSAVIVRAAHILKEAVQVAVNPQLAE